MFVRIAVRRMPLPGVVRVTTLLAKVAVLMTAISSPARAQFARLSAAAEAGVAIGATHSLTASSERSALPVLFRASLFERVTLWSVDMDFEFRNRRVVSGAVKSELGTSATLLRVLSRSVDGDAWTRRPYVGVGYTSTTLSPSRDTSDGKMRGISVVAGKRIAVGTFGVMRPELSWTRDWRARPYLPSSAGLSRFPIRVGISATNPTTW